MRISTFNILLSEFNSLNNQDNIEKFKIQLRNQLANHPESTNVFRENIQDILDICYEVDVKTNNETKIDLIPKIESPEIYDLNKICKLLNIRTGSSEYKNFKSKLTYDRNHENIGYEKSASRKKYFYTFHTMKRYLQIYFPDFYQRLLKCNIGI